MIKVTLENRLKTRERPNETAVLQQNWRDLLFLHWKYDADKIQSMLPPGLYVDTFEGNAYISLVPLFMKNSKFANMFSLPGFSDFIEVNVRTYVYDKQGIPGVWFFSLDLNSMIAAKTAKMKFYLPYFFAELNEVRKKNKIVIEGKRIEKPQAFIQFNYEPSSKNPHLADPESLEFFLVERYILYAFGSNELYKGRIHHLPYSLSDVNVLEWNHDLLKVNSLDPSNPKPDAIHYSSGVDVEIFNLNKA